LPQAARAAAATRAASTSDLFITKILLLVEKIPERVSATRVAHDREKASVLFHLSRKL
jgi:hypothetical protein